MGVIFHTTSGPVLEKAGNLAAMLTNLNHITCCLLMTSTVFREWSKSVVSGNGKLPTGYHDW
ncbi:hypothetical protein ACLK1S_11650 [Escherichia coli]